MINTKLLRSDYLLLFVYFLVFVMVEVYDHSFYFNQTNYTFVMPDGSSYSQANTVPSLKGYIVGVPTSLICTFSIVLIFFLWLIPKYLIRGKNYIIFSLIGILVLVFIGIIRHFVWHWAEDIPWQVYPNGFELTMKSLSNSASNAGLPLGILLAKKYYETQIQMIQIGKKQKESELKLLQAQIDPHFLFNNLNTLDSLIDEEPEKAKRYIANLAALYRYVINTKDQDVVSLKEELRMIKNYFYLLETRFGDVYIFDIIGDTNRNDKYLPVGALQVLIENVVKHNKVLTGKPLKTIISIEDKQVIVTNNKTNISENKESFGTGLKNLQERYMLLFDKKMAITDSEFGFQVSIPLIEIL